MERGRGRGGMLGLLVVQALSEYYRLEKKLPVTAWLIAANTLIYLRPNFLDPILPTLNQVWFNPHLILKCASDEIIELSVLQQPKQHRRSDLLRTASLTFETLPMKAAKHLVAVCGSHRMMGLLQGDSPFHCCLSQSRQDLIFYSHLLLQFLFVVFFHLMYLYRKVGGFFEFMCPCENFLGW